MSELRYRRRYKRLVRAISRTGGVAKVKMQLPDGRWVYGVFLPYEGADGYRSDSPLHRPSRSDRIPSRRG